MKELMIILFSAILVNNYPLSKFLGICPFLGVSKKLDSAVGMSAAVIFVMLMATAATWPIYDMLVIAALVQLVETILKKYVPALYKALGVYLPLITTNCAVLGVTVLNITENYNFVESMVNSLGAGLGFMLAMVLFAGVRTRLENIDAPKYFQGLPITLLAASLVSASFIGFSGVVDGLFM